MCVGLLASLPLICRPTCGRDPTPAASALFDLSSRYFEGRSALPPSLPPSLPCFSSLASEHQHQILSIMFRKCQTRPKLRPRPSAAPLQKLHQNESDDNEMMMMTMLKIRFESGPAHLLSPPLFSPRFDLLVPLRHCLSSQRGLEIPRHYSVQSPRAAEHRLSGESIRLLKQMV